MALDRPFDDGHVQTANVALNASTVSAKYNVRFNVHVHGKTNFIFPTFRLVYEAAEAGVSDQRGKRKTAELHTSGAKRAEPWQGGVEW